MLQEEEKQEAEEANDDADVNIEANKIDKNNNATVVSIKEEQKTLEYQETMNADVENTANKKRKN